MKLSEYLPRHLRHLEHSKLFSTLEQSISHFAENQIVTEAFMKKLVEICAAEFENAFDKYPINSKTLDISTSPPSTGIMNYRFDRGYWSIVLSSTHLSITQRLSEENLNFKNSTVSLEGSGGGLRKGKRKSESIKRAHSRQIAKDVRWDESGAESESDENEFDDDSSDWTPR